MTHVNYMFCHTLCPKEKFPLLSALHSDGFSSFLFYKVAGGDSTGFLNVKLRIPVLNAAHWWQHPPPTSSLDSLPAASPEWALTMCSSLHNVPPSRSGTAVPQRVFTPRSCGAGSISDHSGEAFALGPPRVLTVKAVGMSAQAWLLDARFPTWVRTVLP